MDVSGKKATHQFSSSTTSMGSDGDFEVYCQPCDRDGPRLPAHGYCTNCSEHLCETCFTVHRKHTMSRHHTLLDKQNMPQTLSSVANDQPDNLTKPCSKHKIEMIKFYCHDHNSLLCSVCATLEHLRTSCKVDYIPDISGQIINSKEYQDVSNTIDEMTREANKTLQDMKNMNDKSNMSLTQALDDIKSFRTKINQRLDELEKQVEETAKGIQKENITNITRVETECGNLLKSLGASSDVITHLNKSKQANALFMELKQVEKIIKDYERSIATSDVKEYTFEPNEAISNLLSNEKSIGTLKGRSLKLKLRQTSYTDKINVKTSKDNEPCLITGMIFINPNLLIIADNYNMAVKMVDIINKSVLDQYKLDSWPWDISSVSHDEIAVAVPYKQAIRFMSVSQKNLKGKHAVKVDGECRGISCNKDKMVVTFLDPVKVQILLLNGTVLQTIQDENIFKCPRYVTTSDNYIYVSDRNMKTPIKLNWEGGVKGRYECRSKPCGLTMSDDETLFVCYDDNTITEISEDFTKGLTVVKDTHDPLAVCWNAETCTLYSSSWTYDGEKNFIKIFKF